MESEGKDKDILLKMKEEKSVAGVHTRLVLTMIFWGGTFVAGRLLAALLHPLMASSLRFAVASLLLLSTILVREKRFPLLTLRQWGAMTLLGLSGVFLYNIFFFTGLQSVEAGRASMIIAVNPVVTTLLAMLLLGERYTFLRKIGMLLSVCGAFIVISRGEPTALLQGDLAGGGELYIVGCVLSWSAYTLIGKQLLKNIEPLVAVAYSCTIGACLLAIVTVCSGHLPELSYLNIKAGACVLYLGFFGTSLGFIWFYDGVKRLGAGRAAMYVNLVPVSGVLLGILFLDEKIGSSLLIGGAFVFSGLYLLNRKEHHT